MEANIQEEIWKDIPEFTGYYQASNLGRIRRLETLVKNRHGGFSRKKGRILKCGFNSKNGYLCASICVMGHTMPRTVHSMVAKTFIDNPNNKPQVNHIDSNRINNNILNLEWVTISENRIHCIKAGNGPKRGHTAIINKDIAEHIRTMSDAGKNQFEIAALLRIHQSTVSRIVNRKRQYAYL